MCVGESITSMKVEEQKEEEEYSVVGSLYISERR
jgi:hypothetical protein